MYKIKNKKAATKRFRLTAGGIKFRHANRRHLFTGKSRARKNNLRGSGLITAREEHMIMGLLPNH